MVVTDSGTGMDATTKARIFEPFFTTKEAGRGTGLGLSMCHEIVKQADGFIEVASELGVGTTFRIYLPRVPGVMDEYEKQLNSAELRGVEKVLVAEDDEQVRALARRALSRAGYNVVEVDNGLDALDEMKRPGARFDLLLTNMVMPIMSGPELVGEVRALYPALRVLVMSGHNAAALAHSSLPSTDTSVLQKPFTPDELARKVRWVLDGPVAAAGEAT
jgi:CheY-like chemotaxis protein